MTRSDVANGSRRGAALPYALAFVASFCVMLVELVAGRMLSRHVGASLYSWTFIIGVILGGISIGNVIGGHLADRYPSRPLLAVLFFLAGAVCLCVPYLDMQVALWLAWDQPTDASWILRLSIQVFTVFLPPASLLGTIGPVVAKWAIDQGYATGRTVGNVYAWGALGSIVGTFVSGFWLVVLLGASGCIFTAGGVLGALGCILGSRAIAPIFVVGWPVLAGAIMSYHVLTHGYFVQWSWSLGSTRRPRLEEREAPGRIYTNESLYSLIKVIEEADSGELNLCLDNLIHARYIPGKLMQLSYEYEKIYAAVALRFGRQLEAPTSLFLGGGGYIFPRYVQQIWPKGKIHVAEIDPAVTEACFAVFHLRRDQVVIRPRLGWGSEDQFVQRGVAGHDADEARPIEIFHLDARNHVEDLVRLKRTAPDSFEPFDFIYGDAFNDYSVPFHLVTQEFVAKVKEVLRPSSGIYLLNVIDIFASGKFLGAILNTIGSEFPHIYIYATIPDGPSLSPTGRDTFIVVAALRELDLSGLGGPDDAVPFRGAALKPAHFEILRRRSGGMVLRDEYSPVENLLEEVVRRKSQY